MSNQLPTVSIKGKDYVMVKDRIAWLASTENEEDYSIGTDCSYNPELKAWVCKATLELGGRTYTGYSQAVEGSTMINKTSALENAETSAVGRACAMAGIGIIESIASADEVHKAINREID